MSEQGPRVRHFHQFTLPREDMDRLGAKRAFGQAMERVRKQLADAGALPDSIKVYRAWRGADAMSVSVEFELPPDPIVLPEWAPTPLEYWGWGNRQQPELKGPRP